MVQLPGDWPPSALKSFESSLTISLSYSFIQRERAGALLVSPHLPWWAGGKAARKCKEEWGADHKKSNCTQKNDRAQRGNTSRRYMVGNTGMGGSEGGHEYIQRNAPHVQTSVALGKKSQEGVRGRGGGGREGAKGVKRTSATPRSMPKSKRGPLPPS